MEGHGPDTGGLRAENFRQPVLQLVGGLVGEGNGNDAPGQGRVHGAQPVHPCRILLGKGLLDGFQETHVVLSNVGGDIIGIAAGAEADEVGNPVDEYRGLSAARTGQQEQRSLSGQRRLELHIVQIRKAPGNGIPPGRQKSFL